MSYSTLYVTCSNQNEAEKIAKSLITSKLAACVNILPKVVSFYFWEGKVQEDGEVVFFAKTKSKLVLKARKMINELHSYSVPCVVEYSIKSGNEDYFKWIDKNCIKQ